MQLIDFRVALLCLYNFFTCNWGTSLIFRYKHCCTVNSPSNLLKVLESLILIHVRGQGRRPADRAHNARGVGESRSQSHWHLQRLDLLGLSGHRMNGQHRRCRDRKIWKQKQVLTRDSSTESYTTLFKKVNINSCDYYLGVCLWHAIWKWPPQCYLVGLCVVLLYAVQVWVLALSFSPMVSQFLQPVSGAQIELELGLQPWEVLPLLDMVQQLAMALPIYCLL